MPDTVASLYEQLFPLTTVMKQRFVDNFSGDDIDSDRWGKGYQDSNAGTYDISMNDAVDGGLRCTSNTGTNHGVYIGFVPNASAVVTQSVRQYAHNGSVIIWGQRWNTISSEINSSNAGFMEQGRTDAASVNMSVCRFSSGSSFFQHRVANGGGSQTDTASTVSTDTSLHTHKIELTSTNSQYTIDGVLEATITTNLPAAKFAPCFGLQNGATGTSSEFDLLYVECYNT